MLTKLSGSPAKSGPLDFGTKNNFPSFFFSEKGLVHIYKNATYYFPDSYFNNNFNNMYQTLFTEKKNEGKLFFVPKSSGPLLAGLPLKSKTHPLCGLDFYR